MISCESFTTASSSTGSEDELVREASDLRTCAVSTIIASTPGLTAGNRNVYLPSAAFGLLITDDMMHIIVGETNRKAVLCVGETWQHADHTEMKAFLGLLQAGDLKKEKEAIIEIYFTVFQAIMARNQFLQLLRHIRFDNYHIRKERHEADKLAPVRE
ncbi:hypothetical protein T10_9685 [Trichinella papuae]|uniref:PiggyBac transposable element-derived protein domain-containing protein n=1 Tax=Trichinella papuae TaxID=268474 RepID=A0A0V1MN32_9BILA|nr:hypothetical protein T10_9685 [Trichinella papuae]